MKSTNDILLEIFGNLNLLSVEIYDDIRSKLSDERKELWKAYRKSNVTVSYEDRETQIAYLIAYHLPYSITFERVLHSSSVLRKVFLDSNADNEDFDFLEQPEEFGPKPKKIVTIGGGPGSIITSLSNFVSNRQSGGADISKIDYALVDICPWDAIYQEGNCKNIYNEILNSFNLYNEDFFKMNDSTKELAKRSDILVFKNLLNEILKSQKSLTEFTSILSELLDNSCIKYVLFWDLSQYNSFDKLGRIYKQYFKSNKLLLHKSWEGRKLYIDNYEYKERLQSIEKALNQEVLSISEDKDWSLFGESGDGRLPKKKVDYTWHLFQANIK